jgi:hypothetical protein
MYIAEDVYYDNGGVFQLCTGNGHGSIFTSNPSTPTSAQITDLTGQLNGLYGASTQTWNYRANQDTSNGRRYYWPLMRCSDWVANDGITGYSTYTDYSSTWTGGPGVLGSGNITTSASYTVPAAGSTGNLTVSSTSLFSAGQYIVINNSGIPLLGQVSSITSSTVMVVLTINPGSATTISSGTTVALVGLGEGVQSTASYTVAAVGSTGIISTVTSNFAVNNYVQTNTGYFGIVTEIQSTTAMTVKTLVAGSATKITSGTSFSLLSLQGLGGTSLYGNLRVGLTDNYGTTTAGYVGQQLYGPQTPASIVLGYPSTVRYGVDFGNPVYNKTLVSGIQRKQTICFLGILVGCNSGLVQQKRIPFYLNI